MTKRLLTNALLKVRFEVIKAAPAKYVVSATIFSRDEQHGIPFESFVGDFSKRDAAMRWVRNFTGIGNYRLDPEAGLVMFGMLAALPQCHTGLMPLPSRGRGRHAKIS